MRLPSHLLRIAPLVVCVWAGAACKESMHPEPESAPAAEPETKPEPSKTSPTPATPSATSGAIESTHTTADKKEVTEDGYEVIRSKTADGKSAEVAVKAPEGWKVTQPPNAPDPHSGKFTLADALKGMPPKGALSATIATTMGSFQCELYDDKAPITVANFVGLARGLRKFWSGKDGAWVARPYYDGTTFHRVIPGFMIQGGDWAGDGSGGIYYTIPDEVHGMKHDKGGLLCMANRGPNTNEAQFFITEAAAAHLDSSYTIFGSCTPTDLVYKIARVPQSGPPNNRPLTPVVIDHVTIQRGGVKAPAATSGKADESLPKNTVPGVVPPGKAVQVTDPAR
jgi:peptidyl-prolyl cis-trans isomerase A (cyclophilin A)